MLRLVMRGNAFLNKKFLVHILGFSLLFSTTVFAEQTQVIQLSGDDLSLNDVINIAENRANIAIAPEGIKRIEASRALVNHYIEKKIPAYGINTMYGQDFEVILPQSEIKRISRLNLIHEATMMGTDSASFVEPAILRSAWALLVNSWAKGFSGVSLPLAKTIVARVNTGRIPTNIEDGGSMGDADLTMNAALALSLFEEPGFEVAAGDATNLLTNNFISIARAIILVNRFKRLLPRAKVALALSMEGYRANPSPLSNTAMKVSVLESKRQIQKDMQSLLKGSKRWKKGGPRRLQDFLSMRTSADILAAVSTALARLERTLAKYCNAFQVSPMIDAQAGRILSVTEWDTTQLTLDMDYFRQALGLMAIATNARTLKVISRPFIDLPSGLASGDPSKFDGIYTRNLTYWMTSITRNAQISSKPVTDMSISFMAEGDEDYSPPFPDSVVLGERLVQSLEKIVSIEALIGAVAIERRLQKGELTQADLPETLRVVQKEIIKRSPLATPAEKQHSLAPLLAYFIDEYQPPRMGRSG